MRWIWIDRFVAFKHREFARAVKNLSRAEDVFAEHFPGYPVMPASLLLEGLAQTGGILVGEARDFREKVVLAKINRARFHREALAGTQLAYDAELLTIREEGASVAGKVYVVERPLALPADPRQASGRPEPPGPLVAEAEIFFAHLDQSRSQQVFGDRNFVFSGELKHLLGLARVLAGRADKDAAVPG
jgi:3-hydroxyacyl-[acyl-carrier-protein] dehydratase